MSLHVKLLSFSKSIQVVYSGFKVKVKVAQSCQTLCNPMDYKVHGILQVRILEWVAFPFSRGSSQPRDRTWVSCIAGGFFTNWGIRETLWFENSWQIQCLYSISLFVFLRRVSSENLLSYNKKKKKESIQGKETLVKFYLFWSAMHIPSVKFSCSVISDSLWSHELQHSRPPCSSSTPRACSNSCPSSWWCHSTTSSFSKVWKGIYHKPTHTWSYYKKKRNTQIFLKHFTSTWNEIKSSSKTIFKHGNREKTYKRREICIWGKQQ